MFKVNNRNTRKRHEICSKLTIKTTKRRKWHGSGVFIVNFELISHLFLVFLSLTLSKEILAWYYLAYRFADSTSKTMQKHFKGLIEGERRIEFFPIEWRTKLRLDEGSWFGVYFSHFAILVANICSKSTI